VATALVLSPIAISSWGQSKLVQVEDPFPAVDCAAYDTGKYITDKLSEACRSFVQLAKAKDPMLPLLVGPVYACFEINDQLFVIDTAMDQAKSDNKEWAALARPSVAFYRSGIENGTAVLTEFMNGKWNLSLSAMGVVSYSGTTDNEMAKESEKLNKITVPRVALAITETSINFADFEIQASTGRFRYWIPANELFPGAKPGQLPGQCATFKRDFKMESSSKANNQHTFWRQVN
jgi:hypothetical protein